ncbi:hypothetical protein [Salinibacter ruber]|uniref:hypothetical protein n=1 Tax=Salinibacter ruber TaxID=146919 RepID=UPI002167E60C|nr:hypothetical protein [Salinibacter ruber]
MTRKQIDALSQERLNKLHKRTTHQAGQEIPNRPGPVKQSAALQRMKTLRGNLQ